MKKIISILFLSLLLNGSAHAKVKTVEKNNDYIILKYSSLLELDVKKQRKLFNKAMMVAADHCNSIGKDAYWFMGFARGEGFATRGTYLIDIEFKKLKKGQYRIICSKDLQSGLKLFKNRVASYNSELNLNIRPREYLINSIENKKKIPSLKEEKKKKIMDKQESAVKKTDNPAEERNKLLISCLKDNRETSKKLRNTECEAYADGKEVDIGDDSGNPNEFSEMRKKNENLKKKTNTTFGGPRENAERVAALSFYRIECGYLTSKGKTMLSSQKSNMDQSVYRATQRNLSDLVIVEGIDKTCNMLFGVLKPQSLVQ
tara:strand:- start:84 stop:1031 length:948 start_codon:yes stop_codon:yes gene_type:complete